MPREHIEIIHLHYGRSGRRLGAPTPELRFSGGVPDFKSKVAYTAMQARTFPITTDIISEGLPKGGEVDTELVGRYYRASGCFWI